ncbi:MAG: YcxB family protein [Erysipelotrichaceae bacterium]|nr:YcxB family protein [Erysipelotrichaceae bacterium]
MVIKYTINKHDMKPYLLRERLNSKQYAEEVRQARGMYVFMAGALLLLGIFFAFQYFVTYKQDLEHIKTLSNAISMAFSAVVLFLMQFLSNSTKKLFAKWEINGKIKKMPENMAEEVELKLDDNNISWKVGKKSGSQKMTEKFETADDAQNYYVYFKKETVIVPKRVFEEYDEKQFRKMLRIEK